MAPAPGQPAAADVTAGGAAQNRRPDNRRTDTMTIDLTETEIELLIEALTARASRHESMSRANPRAAGPHDRAAAAMHKLRARLAKVAA
jgi:hypothetical protein